MTKTKYNPYEEITNQVVTAMKEHGTNWPCPWQQNVKNGLPSNVVTGNHYRGINIWLLCFRNMPSPIWGTFKQWFDLGGGKKDDKGRLITPSKYSTKGAKGTKIYFNKPMPYQDKITGEDKAYWMMKSYTVFNLSQVSGTEDLPIKDNPNLVELTDDITTHEPFEGFVSDTKAKIINGNGRAYFSPLDDVIGMPSRETFTGTKTSTSTEAYYSTLAHELIHWSGGATRLDRLKTGGKRSTEYAFEELVAELGSVFLNVSYGIKTKPSQDNAQYLNGWISKLQNDHKYITTAMTQASKAIDHLNSYQEEAA